MQQHNLTPTYDATFPSVGEVSCSCFWLPILQRRNYGVFCCLHLVTWLRSPAVHRFSTWSSSSSSSSHTPPSRLCGAYPGVPVHKDTKSISVGVLLCVCVGVCVCILTSLQTGFRSVKCSKFWSRVSRMLSSTFWLPVSQSGVHNLLYCTWQTIREFESSQGCFAQ